MSNPPPLFDANGSFGCGAAAPPNFWTAAEFLHHLDRLGVARSLVWHVEARDLDPLTGNRELLAEIQRTPGAPGRLVPAFVVAPCLLVQRGALEELKKMMADGKVRALRIFPGSLRHELRQIEPVVEALQAHRPALFVDSRDGVTTAELVGLAERFPHLAVVHMQGMWGQLPGMFELLRRTSNVLIETSWIHVRGVVEQMARQFGPERLLFGLGPKSHNGASVAAVADLELDAAGRDLVAHGNLERLLGLDPTPPNPPPSASAGRGGFWRQQLEGKPLDCDVVDAHAHLGPSGMWMVGDRELSQQIPEAIRRMERLGIRTLIVSGLHALFGPPLEGNRLLEQAASPYGERLRGYLAFNPHYAGELAPTFEDFFSRDFFVGFKLLCDYWRVAVTDPRFGPVWEFAEAHRLPILAHTWEGPYNSPALFQRIVAAHPNATFLLGHSGGGTQGRQEAVELARQHPNVYLEWCGSFTTPVPFEETLVQVGCDQVVFGSDALLHSFSWELGRLTSMDVPDEQLRPILGSNMRRILAQRR